MYCNSDLLEIFLPLSKIKPQVNTNDKSVPTIYMITPTYARPQQKAELTRLCHTFLLGLARFSDVFPKMDNNYYDPIISDKHKATLGFDLMSINCILLL